MIARAKDTVHDFVHDAVDAVAPNSRLRRYLGTPKWARHARVHWWEIWRPR